jgi:phage gp16-like protein
VTDRMASGRMPRLVHSAPPQGSARGGDRAKLLAKIHVAKKQLAMEESSYRALLQRLVGLDSAGDATLAQLDAILAEFRRLGFTGKKAKPDHRPQIRMIAGVWTELVPFLDVRGDCGVEKALQAFVERQTKDRLHPQGVSDVRFLNATQANKVLEGLKAWLAREQRKAAAREQAA